MVVRRAEVASAHQCTLCLCLQLAPHLSLLLFLTRTHTESAARRLRFLKKEALSSSNEIQEGRSSILNSNLTPLPKNSGKLPRGKASCFSGTGIPYKAYSSADCAAASTPCLHVVHMWVFMQIRKCKHMSCIGTLGQLA